MSSKKLDEFKGYYHMFGVGHPLRIPAESGCELLWVSPFAAKWASDATGAVLRPAPQFVEIQSTSSIDEAGRLQELKASLLSDRSVYAPTNFCIKLPDATLVGERAIIPRTSGIVITDSLHWNHSARIFESEIRRRFEAVHLDFVDGLFVPTLSGNSVACHEEDAVLLSSMEQGNYGAFLLRVIPKLATINHLGIRDAKFFVAADFEWQRKVLGAFGVKESDTIAYDRTKVHRFKSLIVPDMPTSEFFPSDMVSEFLNDFVSRTARSDTSRGSAPRLYVSRVRQSRQRPHYRVLQNEIELIEKLEELGFCIYEPECHSFEDQVRTFAAAEIVVGPSGAGMFNTIFCPERTRILSLESMPTWAHLHANLYGGRKHIYAMLLGGSDPLDKTEQRRWTADIPAVVAWTKQLL